MSSFFVDNKENVRRNLEAILSSTSISVTFVILIMDGRIFGIFGIIEAKEILNISCALSSKSVILMFVSDDDAVKTT